MNKIHSAVLAIVLSVFLIQATDPPYEKPYTSLLPHLTGKGFPPHPFIKSDESVTVEKIVNNTKDLKELEEYLSNIQKEANDGKTETYDTINKFLQKDGKTDYEKLLERDFIRPLLKLYDQNETTTPIPQTNAETNALRISKEDNIYDIQTLTKEELNTFLENPHTYQVPPEFTEDDHQITDNENAESHQNERFKRIDTSENFQDDDIQNTFSKDDIKALMENAKSFEKTNQTSLPKSELESSESLESRDSIEHKESTEVALIRRDDSFLDTVNDNEHIGEILPPEYDITQEQQNVNKRTPILRRRNYNTLYRNGRQFEDPRYLDPRYRAIRFKPPSEFEPSGVDESLVYAENHHYHYRDQYTEALSDDSRMYTRPARFPFVPQEARFPRYKEMFYDQPGRDQSGPDQQSSWRAVRRPRVIFPSDTVTFKDAPQEEQFLAPDTNLQDLQLVDTRDRGGNGYCAPGASCEFFITCWISGGSLENTCDGLLRGCCQRGSSKATSQGPGLAIGTLEAPRETPKAHSSLLNHESSCGVSNRQQAQRRVVGGEEAGFGTFPWQAYIRIGSSRCGGSLVSRRHVVTAGHCVARAVPRQVHVTLGDYVINSAVEPLPAYTFGVSSIQVHPFFKFTPQADRFDVAVLRLDRTAQSLPHIAPICLPPKGESFLGEVGVAAGWGAMSPGSRLRPQTLQAVKVPVIESRLCERWHRSKGIGVVIYDEMLCAGYKNGGRDSCQGDSGGPLMLQKQNRWYLIGIVSAGYSCAQPGQPGIYHRVSHTVDWITKAIES
ncbi:uncharacterized protein [Onthophagus taurus]|uniref:uncharacterized protein isoform X1 n=1 Tax=Onthophagus taurus TaxID=166361 RepID=UPI0039BE9366